MQGQLQGAPGAPKQFMFSLLRNKADVNLVKGVWHESFFFFFKDSNIIRLSPMDFEMQS